MFLTSPHLGTYPGSPGSPPHGGSDGRSSLTPSRGDWGTLPLFQEVHMSCERCGSLLVPCHPLTYAAAGADFVGEPASRCVCCGNYVDRTILKNRESQRALVAA